MSLLPFHQLPGSSSIVGLIIGKGNQKPQTIKVNLEATTDPGSGDDEQDGYSVFSWWFNTNTKKYFLLKDPTAGAAIWTEVPISNTAPPQNNEASVDPTVTDDGTAGYEVFSMWRNTVSNDVFVMVDDSTGAAIWVQVSNEEQVYVPSDVEPITSDTNLNADGRCYTNEGASGQVIGTLPTATAGAEVEAIVQVAQNFRMLSNTGDTIRLGDKVTITAGYIESAVVGNKVKLKCINATEWIALSGVGTWSVETT